jgi:hypothetical protein
MGADVLKSAFSARGIAFLVVSWGLPVLVGAALWWLVAYAAWSEVPKFDTLTGRVAEAGLSGLTVFLATWAVISLGLGLNATTFFRVLEGYHLHPQRLARRRAKTHWYHRENVRLAEAVAEVEKVVAMMDSERASTPSTDPALAELEKRLERAKTYLEDLKEESAKAEARVKSRVLMGRRRFTSRPWGMLPRWRDYPAEERHFLPTRLGNRIRAFERYGNYRYGLDVLILWYEFVSVARTQLLPEIEVARQKVEIFVAAAVVSTLLALSTAFPLLFPDAREGRILLLGGIAIGALGLSVAMYRKAVAETRDWERSVVALTNTAKKDVATNFGVSIPPTIEEERKVWATIVGFVQLGNPEYATRLDGLREKYPLPALTSAAERVLNKFQ